MSWVDRALCRGMSSDIFFPPEGGNQARQAQRICRQCPVVSECLADAQRMEGQRSHEYIHGIRGGLTPRQRADMNRRQRVA